MKKLILSSILSVVFLSLSAQNITPSTYENSKYDKYHGWDKVRSISESEHNVLIANNVELRELLFKLRDNNKSRANVSSLPKEVRELEYVKLLTHSDGTVPVFKLVDAEVHAAPITSSPQVTRGDVARVRAIFAPGGMKTYEEIPEQFKSYLEETDEPMQYALRDEDFTVIYGNQVSFTQGSTSSDIFDICESNADEDGNISTATIPTVSVRYFVSANGDIEYVDYKSNQKEECIAMFKETAKSLYLSVTFKPAKRAGVPVDSYVEVVYVPWVYSQEEWDILQAENKAFQDSKK